MARYAVFIELHGDNHPLLDHCQLAARLTSAGFRQSFQSWRTGATLLLPTGTYLCAGEGPAEARDAALKAAGDFAPDCAVWAAALDGQHYEYAGLKMLRGGWVS